ncbi:MAG: HAD family hydrolase [Flavobacteriales bacterium]
MSRADPDPGRFPELKGVDTLLLDLGGVLIDIDPWLSTKAFARLGQGDILEEHSKAEQDRLFDRFERGEIDAGDFRKELKERGGIDASDEAIDEAWNALLLDIPRERFEFLERAADTYRLHLFSNTNPIHMEGFMRIVERSYGFRAFKEFFEGIHLSYEMGSRKPEPLAFDRSLEKIGSEPERVFFIDDTEAHVRAARSRGIIAYHLGERELTDLEKLLIP